MIAKHLAADQMAKLGPQLREIINLDDDDPVTPEILLLKVVAAVHADGEVELSLKDVRGAAKRNERMAAAAGILAGGIGCIIVDLYAWAALFWLLVDCFDLELSDADIAANLLVAWGAFPEIAVARRVMDPVDEMTIAGEAWKRYEEKASVLTKADAVRILWQLHSGVPRIPLFEPSSFKDVFFAGHALQERLDGAAVQLGLSKDDVRKPSLLRRLLP